MRKSEYKRRLRAMAQNLAQMDAKQDEKSLELKDRRPEDVGLYGMAVSRYQTERRHTEMEMKVLEAQYLLEKARRWRVEGSPPQEIYDPNFQGVEPRPFFTPENKKKMEEMIYDAQLTWWKEWSKFIIPIISLIISIFALIRTFLK